MGKLLKQHEFISSLKTNISKTENSIIIVSPYITVREGTRRIGYRSVYRNRIRISQNFSLLG